MNQRRLIATGSALLASAILAACGSMGGKPSTAVELVPTAAITKPEDEVSKVFNAHAHGATKAMGEQEALAAPMTVRLATRPTKLPRISAKAAISPPIAPMIAPSMKPARRPIRPISIAAGMEISAPPTTKKEIGSVASAG